MELTPEVKASLFRRGIVAAWQVRGSVQQDLLKFLYETGSQVLAAAVVARQHGKSWTVISWVVEQCMKRPGLRVQLLCPTGKMMRAVVFPTLAAILADCPQELRPTTNTQDGLWRFPNGAVLRVDGTDAGTAELLRGRATDITVIDEAGFHDEFEKLVYSILLPQTLQTKGRIVAISTWPESPAHPFVAFTETCKAKGAFLMREVEDNELLTEDQKDTLAQAMGGKESTAWLREMRCQLVVEASKAIVPEFGKKKADIVKPVPRPDAYVWLLTAMDLGFSPDPTALLFGYYDFKRAKLCIRSEWTGLRQRSDEIAVAVRTGEEESLGPTTRPDGENRAYRIADSNNPTLLLDMQHHDDVSFMATSKESLEAMVNDLRLAISAGDIEVDPSCTGLVSQLESGIWDNQRKAFARTRNGHFDLLAALIYAWRNLTSIKGLNPYPALPTTWRPETHAPSFAEAEDDNDIQGLEGLFIR